MRIIEASNDDNSNNGNAINSFELFLFSKQTSNFHEILGSFFFIQFKMIIVMISIEMIIIVRLK